MAAKFKLLKLFQDSLVEFFDELIEQFPNEAPLIMFRVFIKDQIPPEMIIDHMTKEMLPHKDMVEKRDERFFSETNFMFGHEVGNKINHLQKLWRSETLDENDRKIIWSWIDTFIRLIERYQKLKFENS